MLAHPKTESVTIASKVTELNKPFYEGDKNAELYAKNIQKDFAFTDINHPLSSGNEKVNTEEYDLIWLRLPPPLNPSFLKFIEHKFSNAVVINNPKGILATGTKEYLLNFPSVCPPMKICKSLEDIIEFKNDFPIVLKPLRGYGGKGIVKIKGEEVFKGKKSMSFSDFREEYKKDPIEYLAVKYLKNVGKGDKRIVVVNGEILGASLRLPAKDSWLCNVSMGGSSNHSDVDIEEEEIVKLINPILVQLGIVMYGVDTLVGDDGKRVLSEINTTSIGGLPQIAKLKNQPLVEKGIELIWNYFDKQKN